MDDLTRASRLAGGIWGHLIGDATGVPYEFMNAERIGEVEFGAAGGPWDQPPGTWSDDGSLMLALLDSLLTTGFDPEDQGRRSVAWMDEGDYTPAHAGKFDIGTTTSEALRAIRRGVPAVDAGPTGERSSSNGSLMRILPLALVERDGWEPDRQTRAVDDLTLVRHAHEASRVTHGHPRCQVACALYALVVRRLLDEERPTPLPQPALDGALATLRAIYAGDDALAPHLAALDELEAWREQPHTGRGFVLDAFWSAWDAFAGARDYRDTIVRAIRLGNDTDTTAAIAGGLAGVRWGWEDIPVAWRRGMRGREVATPFVDRLVATTGPRTSTLSPLRIDPIDLDGIERDDGGRLGITFLPGKKRDGYTGNHWRDVDADAATLRDAGWDVLFLLVEDEELVSCRVPDVAEALDAVGVELVRCPIRDPRIPTPQQEAGYRLAIADLVARVRGGGSVAIACRGGIDRSGMTAACVLIEAGIPIEEAIDRVHAGRHGSLTYRDQLVYVKGWVVGGSDAPDA